MAKKLAPVKDKKPTSITLFEINREVNDWVETCKLVWKDDIWQIEGDNQPDWVLDLLDEGKFYDDRRYKATDRDFYLPLIYSSGSMYSFVADD